jgi:hypothetical protein
MIQQDPSAGGRRRARPGLGIAGGADETPDPCQRATQEGHASRADNAIEKYSQSDGWLRIARALPKSIDSLAGISIEFSTGLELV